MNFDYEVWAERYLLYGESEVRKTLIRKGKNTINENFLKKWASEQKAVQEKPPHVQRSENENPQKANYQDFRHYPKEVREVISQKNEAHHKAMSLRLRLRIETDLQKRFDLGTEVIDLLRKREALWAKINYFHENGELPKEKVELEISVVDLESLKRRKNTIKRLLVPSNIDKRTEAENMALRSELERINKELGLCS